MDVLRHRMRGPRTELICVGTELLTGKLNTHGSFLSARLEEVGLPLSRETTVSDDPVEMERLFRETWSRAEVVLVTGGLGPTFDDVTRDVWAKVCGRKLVLRSDLLKGIADRFRRRGLKMPPANRRQAQVIQGARVLNNEWGTAPGQWLAMKGKTLVLLPGPGREMKPIFQGDVIPLLTQRYSPGARATKIWRFFGRPESAVDQQLRGILTSKGGLSWGILAQDGLVDVKMTVSGKDPRAMEKILADWDAKVRKRFGNALFGQGGDTLESVVGDLLRRSGNTLAVAESCTGGGLAKKITSIPGSSDYFWGGTVTYANRAKVKLLGVKEETIRKFGAVSARTAKEMAEGQRKLSRTNFALSITGVAGPTGGTEKKPVGRIYIALAGPRKTRILEKKLSGDRSQIRTQSALWALYFLYREFSKASPKGTS